MVTPEEGHSAAAAVAHKSKLPGDMRIGLKFMQGKAPGTDTMLDLISVRVEILAEDDADVLRTTYFMHNTEAMQAETFEVWLLGYTQGHVMLTKELDAQVLNDMMDESQQTRLH